MKNRKRNIALFSVLCLFCGGSHLLTLCTYKIFTIVE